MTEPSWAGTLSRRGKAALMATYGRYQLELASGSGCRLVDATGREYLDFVAGIAVNSLGHSHPAVVEAIREAADGLLHVSNLYWSEPMVRLAERLTRAGGMEKAFFCNSGAEAVEAGLKLARKARPGRPGIICFDRSFHGRTLGALSTTAQAAYQNPFLPLLPGVEILPFGDFEAASAAIGPGGEHVAAVLVEPIQGEGGIRPAPPGWLAHLEQCCRRAGALLIFDEVQSGLGRTGTFFAFQNEGVVPDAVASAKALGGGLPMGALLARGSAAEAFEPGDHASTFGGGPFVAAVANSVLDVVLAPGFLEEVRDKGRHLLAQLERLVAASPLVVEARGRGLMLGLALAEPRAAELTAAARELGLLVCPAGPEVVRLVPPLTASLADLDEGSRLLELALATVSREAADR